MVGLIAHRLIGSPAQIRSLARALNSQKPISGSTLEFGPMSIVAYFPYPSPDHADDPVSISLASPRNAINGSKFRGVSTILARDLTGSWERSDAPVRHTDRRPRSVSALGGECPEAAVTTP